MAKKDTAADTGQGLLRDMQGTCDLCGDDTYPQDEVRWAGMRHWSGRAWNGRGMQLSGPNLHPLVGGGGCKQVGAGPLPGADAVARVWVVGGGGGSPPPWSCPAVEG